MPAFSYSMHFKLEDARLLDYDDHNYVLRRMIEVEVDNFK